jgi:SAM-dependent methyltransferase
MPDFIHHIVCPVCHSQEIKNILQVKDYTVSGKTFDIAECSACSFRFTQNAPDAASISPYYKSENYISHTDASDDFIGRLYKRVRKITLQQKRKLVQKSTGLQSGNLLDVGSGTGAFVHVMKEHGWQVQGLEPDADARVLAQKLYKTELQDAAQFYLLPEIYYDAITLWHVLEHVHDLHAYVGQLKKMIKPEGKIFIAVPNYTSADAEIYKEYWAAYDVPRHLWHFSPGSMKTLMKKHGLKITACKPMWYDSFYISMMSNRYKTGKLQMISALWRGFLSNLKALGHIQRCSSVIFIISK